MKIKKILLLFLAILAVSVQAQPGMEKQVLPLDTAVRIGRLSNGLTYYIRHNNWPEHRANFYIAQKVGSIQEEESQRGLAHFLEHMCFNGTKHFPDNEIIRWCESIGVKFGTDLNAYTSITQTVYNISNVPTARQSALDSCLLVLSDWSSDLTLDPKEIDKERGVIHEEWRTRSSASSRLMERSLPKLYPDSKYGLRFPIGLMSVVDNFKYDELRKYYEKWYHPSNQGIIIVGDVNVDAIEKSIKRLFGDIKEPANPAPVVAEQVPDNAQPIVIIDKDKELKVGMVEAMMKHDAFPDSLKNTMSYILYNYVSSAALTMLNSRYAEAVQEADCPFAGASASFGSYLYSDTKDAFDISMTPKDITKTEEALEKAFMEARRAAEFGFTESEYSRFKADMLSSLDNMWNERDKRTNDYLAQKCINNFINQTSIMDISLYYNMSKNMVNNIPLEAVNSIMKEMVTKNDSNLVIINFNTEKEGTTYPTRESLLGAVDKARKADITAYVDNVKDEPLISELPKAGNIVSEKKNNTLGYTELKLSNGVTVVLKKTDFNKDQVIMSGEGNGGSANYGLNDVDNCNMFDNVIGISGLGNFSSTELRKALAGKIANADLSMKQNVMQIGGSSTPKDMETMMQLTYLYFTDINKDMKSYDNLMENMALSLKNRSLSEMTALGDTAMALMYDRNPRMTPMTVERLKNVNYDRILQIAKERTASANGWKFYIIGNYDESKIKDLVCQYLGALPSGKAVAKPKRVSELTSKTVTNTFTRKMETPKAFTYLQWLNKTMPYSLENALRASITGQILEMILIKKIREDASAAYSVSASCSTSPYKDMKLTSITGVCPVKPELADTAVSIMNREVKNLAYSVDESMLNKVKEYMTKTHANSIKTNGYWQGVIQVYHQFGIDCHTTFNETLSRQTTDSIKAFMKGFLKKYNEVTITMLPDTDK